MAGDPLDFRDPIGSFVPTWRRILLDPRAFYESLPLQGGLQAPATFAAICLAIGGVEFLVFGGGLKGALGFVVLGLVRLFLGAAIVTLVAENLFEGKGDYEATFRVLAYSTAIAAFLGLPILKFLAAIYGAFLVVVGLEAAHRFDAPRAVLTLIATAAVGAALIYAFGLWDLAQRVNPLFQ
ncbi:MAG: YIP1 family protein [Candidatus Binatia bacterium]